MENLFSQTQALITEVIALEDDLDGKLVEFLELRTKLHAILDDEIQMLTHQDLAEATQIAYDMEDRTYTFVLVLLLVGLACGTFIAVGITRGITFPVSKLVSASRAIARGDLSQRANIQSKDEFGILGQSFDQMILQRQWAQEELEARVQDRTSELVEVNEVMDLVDEVARIVTSTLNIGEVYEKFTQELKKLVNFDRASINVIDQEAGTATLKFLFGPARAGHAVGTVSSLQDSENQTVLETGQTLLREDAAVVQYAADLGHANNGLRAAVRVPLISNGKIFGTISLRSREVDVYGPREQAILERLAEQIAPAIENSQLYGQLQASMEEMALADEVARIVTSTLDIGEVYEKFALEVKKLVDFDVMNINLIDREAADFTTRYLVGGDLPEPQLGDTRPLEGTRTQHVIETGRTLVRSDTAVNPHFPNELDDARVGLRSSIALPLISKGEACGILSLRSRRLSTYGPGEQAILERLAGQIAPALQNARLYEETQTEKERTAATLAQLEAVLETVGEGIVAADSSGKIVMVNQAVQDIWGHRAEELIGESLQMLIPEKYRQAHSAGWERYQQTGVSRVLGKRLELEGVRKDGSIFPLEIQITETNIGERVLFTAAVRDITESKNAEEQLSHAQKMETVGRLAGGVAYDFNNLLTAIMGYSEMSLQEAPQDSPIIYHLHEVKKASERAANLTNQLLAFSRRQVIEPQVIDLNDLAINLDKMLRRLIGEDVELVTMPATDLEPVKADPGQIEQVLMNLAVNARDAMPTGGKLTVETANVTLVINVNYFCRLATIIFASAPPAGSYRQPPPSDVLGLDQSGSWAHRTPGSQHDAPPGQWLPRWPWGSGRPGPTERRPGWRLFPWPGAHSALPST